MFVCLDEVHSRNGALKVSSLCSRIHYGMLSVFDMVQIHLMLVSSFQDLKVVAFYVHAQPVLRQYLVNKIAEEEAGGVEPLN